MLKWCDAGLASWAEPEANPFDPVRRVLTHPGFAEGARTLALGMLELAAQDPALDGIFKDAGRYFVAMWSFALQQNEGLTLPRLKAICTGSGLLSAGRAQAQLQFLEHLGYVQRRAQDGWKARTYDATPAFVAAWNRQLEVALAAARPIAPDVDMLMGPARAAVRQTYARRHASAYLAALQGEQPIPAFLRVFLHPYAGNHILWVLLASSSDPGFPPMRAGPVSIRGLAAQSGVSRIQVARIFQEAKAEGLVHLDADGYVHFSPAARAELGFFYAFQLTQILIAAAEAADDHGLTRRA